MMRDYQLPGRSPVYAANGMAATAHPSASQTAVDVLRSGGNAIDAAIAAAAVLAVVEPAMSGIGGDCFALVSRDDNAVKAYNGSGAAGQAQSTERLLELGVDEVGPGSPHSVTVPGAVEAWQALLDDCGTRDLEELLQPAIRYAEDGYIVQPRIAAEWYLGLDRLSAHEASRQTFLKSGEPYRAGDLHRNPGLGDALRAIATLGAEGFYTGPVAEDVVGTLQDAGSLLTLDDFAGASGRWDEPIVSDYRGYQVLECQPNGQGFIVPLMLNVLEQFPLDAANPHDAANLHLQIEASRLAFDDRDHFFAENYDTEGATRALDELLGAEHAKSQGKRIDPRRALSLTAQSRPPGGDTSYVTVADAAGNTISLMDSLYWPFGSGIVSKKFGILLHNRGNAFEVTGSSRRRIEPGKRPPHTILPAMLTKDGKPAMSFGVVGAERQSPGQVRVVSAMLDSGLDVQQALDAPRANFEQGVVLVENGFSDAWIEELSAFGHRVERTSFPLSAGQAIWIDRERACFVGGSDFRKDGCALGY